MSFISTLLRRQINPDAQSLASDITQTFGQSLPIKGTETLRSKQVADLTVLTKLVGKGTYTEPLLAAVSRIEDVAQKNKEFFISVAYKLPYKGVQKITINSAALDIRTREITVIQNLKTFVASHQEIIDRLQTSKTKHPADYLQDIAELSKNCGGDVIAVLRFLAENPLEKPTSSAAPTDIEKDDLETIINEFDELKEDIATGEVMKPIKTTATITKLSPTELQSRKKMPEFYDTNTENL